MIEGFGAVNRMKQAGQSNLFGCTPVRKDVESCVEVLGERTPRKMATVVHPEFFEEEEGGLRRARHGLDRSAAMVRGRADDTFLRQRARPRRTCPLNES